MEDLDKTMAPIRHKEISSADDLTMPGKRDRKPDGRFQIGDLIVNRYKVLAELGQGGMGVVYRCLDETAGIEIALKALPPELSHNTLEMEDIKDNFQLVAKLVHHNISISKNLEKDNSNGNYYLIMECCNGEDLRRWIRRKRNENTLSLETVLPVIKQIAEALDYAHKQRVIHRDIKPGNIMIDSAGDIKILDFGLAAQIHTSMTRVSMAYHGTSGTGPYMAPEQWRGRAQGAAADQYALAVMTYEMLAGHLPFESQDPSVLREAVLNETAESVPNIPKSAQIALIKAMSKEPAERFECCSDFYLALAGEKKVANKISKTKSIGMISMILLFLFALVGVGIYFSLQHKEQKILVKKQPVKTEEKIIAEEQDKQEIAAAEVPRQKVEEEQRKQEIPRQKVEEEQRKQEVPRQKVEEEQRKQDAEVKLKTETIKIPKKLEDKSQNKKVIVQNEIKKEATKQVPKKSEYLKQAELFYNIKEYDKALAHYNKVTDELSPENLMHQGECYEKIRAFNQAVHCYKLAEKKGYNDPDCRLGKLSEKLGNWKDAVESYTGLIEQKNYYAAYLLSLIYLNSKGGFVEPEKGYELLKNAADSGFVQAQYILGCSYAKIRGTTHFTIIKYDLGKAQQYLQKAKVNGHKDAEKRLKLLGGN